MPLLTNETPEMPTCAAIVRPPITAGDCTNFDTFEELMLHEMTDGSGGVIRNGQGYAIDPVATIETECEAE